MTKIIPIKELKNTSKISEMCNSTDQPIFVTKNGYGDLVIMSMKTYEERLAKLELYEQLAISEKDVEEGLVCDAKESLSEISKKYGL